MCTSEHYRRLERMYLAAPTNHYYSPTIEIREGEAEVVVPVDRKHFHAADAVHGSVYFKILDDSAFFAANSLLEDAFVLTVSFHLHLLRPVREGEMRAVGRVVHRSRRLIVAESEAFDSRGRLIARGTGSFMESGLSLTEEMGYR